MTAVPIVSWNVRGLHNPLKRTMISMMLRKHLPAKCAFQEMHLTPDTLSFLGYSWVGWAFHSTHTSYLRGVSILEHRDLDCHVLDKQIDSEGWYVLLVCRIFLVKCILPFVYIPPPYNSTVLRNVLISWDTLGFPWIWLETLTAT